MSSTEPRAEDRAGRGFRAVAVGGFLLALAYFTWRGLWRGILDSGDLAVGFSAGRAWLIGHNPYDAVVLANDLIAAGGAEVARSGLLDRLQNVYFPTTLPAFAPLALASWPVAKLLFLVANVGGAVFIAVGLIHLLGWRPTQTRAVALAALILALAPLHTTISSGQTAVVATAALVAAMLLERAGRGTWSGVMYGLATAVKVQIGLPFIAYLLWRRRWAAATAASLIIAGATALAVIRMQGAGVPWAGSWLANLSTLAGPGGINDPSPLNPERFSLINLQLLLYDFVPPGELINLLAFGLVGVAALSMVWLLRGPDRHELLALSIVAVLCLLVTYHRYYDAVLLAIPIAWAVSAVRGRQMREGLAVLILSADFLFPFQSAFHDLQQNGSLPAWLTDGPLWSAVLMTQHVWALVLMTVVLLLAAARLRVYRPVG